MDVGIVVGIIGGLGYFGGLIWLGKTASRAPLPPGFWNNWEGGVVRSKVKKDYHGEKENL